MKTERPTINQAMRLLALFSALLALVLFIKYPSITMLDTFRGVGWHTIGIALLWYSSLQDPIGTMKHLLPPKVVFAGYLLLFVAGIIMFIGGSISAILAVYIFIAEPLSFMALYWYLAFTIGLGGIVGGLRLLKALEKPTTEMSSVLERKCAAADSRLGTVGIYVINASILLLISVEHNGPHWIEWLLIITILAGISNIILTYVRKRRRDAHEKLNRLG